MKYVMIVMCRRAVAQRCPVPPMHNLISVGGQHQGMSNSLITGCTWPYRVLQHSWQSTVCQRCTMLYYCSMCM